MNIKDLNYLCKEREDLIRINEVLKTSISRNECIRIKTIYDEVKITYELAKNIIKYNELRLEVIEAILKS